MDFKEEYQKALERAKKGLPIDEVFPELKKQKPMMTTDVCTAKLLNKGGPYEHYLFSCRGVGFLDYWADMPYNYSFLELLEARDIQFIEPDIK